MPEGSRPEKITIADDEKTTPIMIYTANSLIKGDVISKRPIRITTWLRTPMAPEYFHLLNANVLLMSGPASMRSLSLNQCFISIPQVIAYHLVPPEEEPLDFDATEPNRKMEPVSVLVGTFLLRGHIRMSEQTVLKTYLDVAHETYFSLYDSEISNPGMPNMGTLRVPLTILRSDRVTFATQD